MILVGLAKSLGVNDVAASCHKHRPREQVEPREIGHHPVHFLRGLLGFDPTSDYEPEQNQHQESR